MNRVGNLTLMGFGKTLVFVSLENIFTYISVILSSYPLFFSASSSLNANTSLLASNLFRLPAPASSMSLLLFSTYHYLVDSNLVSPTSPRFSFCTVLQLVFFCVSSEFPCGDFLRFSSFFSDKLVFKSDYSFRENDKSPALAETATSSCVFLQNFHSNFVPLGFIYWRQTTTTFNSVS